MQKDKIFSKEIEKKFEFDEAVASVFDDMLSRSVPFYKENQKLIIDFILQNSKNGSKILDLGSSTAKFLLELYQRNQTLKLVGIDNSKPMIDEANKKIEAYDANIKLYFADMLKFEIKNFDYIIANYTLQFIRPLKRPKLIKNIFNGLNKNGYFIFSEKVVFEDKKFDKDIIDIYHKYKENQGYSQIEIIKKREALENVLIPFTIEENITMCKEAGFNNVNTIFQWANFVTFIALK